MRISDWSSDVCSSYLLKLITPRKILTGLAVATALSSAALALSAQAAELRMAWSQDATGLDPHTQTAFSSLRLLELVYEPLVRLDAELNVVPAVDRKGVV